MGDARILVVDDERFFREALRELLESDGRNVRLASTAAEALEWAEDPAIGVVVLDIQLPDQSGLTVLRVLRERRPALRVVMLSAHTDQEYVLEALRLGACDYLAKPLHEEEVKLSVRRALEFERRLAGITRKEATLPNGLRYVYLEGGKGEPLMLLHGFGANKDNFVRVAKYLTPRYRVTVLSQQDGRAAVMLQTIYAGK